MNDCCMDAILDDDLHCMVYFDWFCGCILFILGSAATMCIAVSVLPLVK